MSIIADAFKELLSMFLADARLSTAILFLVATIAGLIACGLAPVLGGGFLLLGCMAILIDAALRGARAGIER
jgi:hypothetical protein